MTLLECEVGEIRDFPSRMSLRSGDPSSDAIELTGSPIVYSTPYSVFDSFGEFRETMAPGVATAILSTADVRFLLNHSGLPLARTKSGTLTLRDTPTALTFSAQLDARQSVATDLAIAIERRDVSQMSCGFIVAEDQWNAEMTQRTVRQFRDFFDVSAVTYPASPTTDISLVATLRGEHMDSLPFRRQRTGDTPSTEEEMRHAGALRRLAVERYGRGDMRNYASVVLQMAAMREDAVAEFREWAEPIIAERRMLAPSEIERREELRAPIVELDRALEALTDMDLDGGRRPRRRSDPKGPRLRSVPLSDRDLG